jgi:hypothetical protein
MDLPWCIAQLEARAPVIAALVGQAPAEQARWKPSPLAWSILEVTNHLADEEVEDFRARLDLTLRHPGEPVPPIAPQRWVMERAYNDRDPGESLARFLAERQRSLDWLRSLAAPDWSSPSARPELRAGDLLAAWVAHDLLHLRQLIELHYAWLAERAAPSAVDYAGPWREEAAADG